MTRVALISGCSGQDGGYLTTLLLDKNYEVFGLIRKSAEDKIQNLTNKFNNSRLHLRYGDLTDGSCITNILSEIKNKYLNLERLEVYNLGAITHVKVSYGLPIYTGELNAIGPLRILEAIRVSGYSDKIRFYQASTSEMFGNSIENNNVPLNETSPFQPRSPYAIAKLFAHWTTVNYREAYGIFACSGILFNHSSKNRGSEFVTRKITLGLSDIIHGRKETLVLGNINSYRDWMHAEDCVRGMWQMLQMEKPDDYVLSSNETHQVREFIEKAFALKGFDIRWEGKNEDEVGIDNNTGRVLITISSEFYRPAEVNLLLGDSSKARKILGWSEAWNFDALIEEMVTTDCSQ